MAAERTTRGSRAFRLGARHRIIDDRRAVVPLCEPSQLPGDAPRKLVSAVEEGNAHRLSFVVRFTVMLALMMTAVDLVLGLAALRISPQVFTTYPLWHRILVKLGGRMLICFPFAVLLMSLHARQRGVEAIKALHAAGLCPSCGYDLRTVSPAGDGCTVCPECGSAWRRPAAAAQ